MDKFNASNGVAVYLDDDGDMDIDNHGRVGLCGGPVVEALREFFRAEEDERLGRWRWPDNPDYVVYPYSETVDGIRVVQISDGHSIVGSRQWFDKHGGGLFAKEQPRMYAAALAYFDAHPERKPWHDAKPGEIWALKFGASDEEDLVQAKDAFFVNLGVDRWFDTTGKRAPEITAGRRIWPEAGVR